MKHSYRLALAGFAALLGSSVASHAASAVVPSGVIMSAVAQSDLKAILRDIEKGVPDSQILSRYDLTATDLQTLKSLADQLGIDTRDDYQRTLQAIVRELR